MKKTKRQLISDENGKEIFWNIVNALIAGFISFLSALLAAKKLTIEVIGIAVITSLFVGVVKFQNYWKREESEYCAPKIFSFIK